MNKQFVNWLIFILLSVIWGSSFILMKLGMRVLSPYQFASLRIIFAGLILLPSAIKYIVQIPIKDLWIVFISGTLGNLVPSFLFCLAEEGIDSGLAGTLNALTPIFVIITGALFFHTQTSRQKITGVLVAFSGSILLLLSRPTVSFGKEIFYTSYVFLATFLYGFNVNMVAKKLHHLSSLSIAAVALSLNAIPALIILFFTGFFSLPLTDTPHLWATGAAALLGIVGTAIATVIFYMLVKRAGSIFATMVTYGIPVVAILWGVVFKEQIGIKQFLCLLIILAGVYITNKKVQVSTNNGKE